MTATTETTHSTATAGGYTNNPTHLRIYFEETGDSQPWHVDGADDFGNYTEEAVRFETYREAVAYLPQFMADTIADGVVTGWHFRPGRRGTIRYELVRPVKGGTAHVVDQDGATFAFPTPELADACYAVEKANGTTSMCLGTVTIPRDGMTWDQVADYAAIAGVA